MRAKCQSERLSESAPGDFLFHVFERFLALFTDRSDVEDRADDAERGGAEEIGVWIYAPKISAQNCRSFFLNEYSRSVVSTSTVLGE